jgi:hypothetical protein
MQRQEGVGIDAFLRLFQSSSLTIDCWQGG